jgi:hypothetical protein
MCRNLQGSRIELGGSAGLRPGETDEASVARYAVALTLGWQARLLPSRVLFVSFSDLKYHISSTKQESSCVMQ